MQLLLEARTEAPEAPGEEDVANTFADLFMAAYDQAPVLCTTWDGGVAALLRIAAAVPRQQWVRSPSETWVPKKSSDDSLRSLLLEEEVDDTPPSDPLVALGALLRHLFCRYDDSFLTAAAGGFTWSDGSGVAYEDREGNAVMMCSGTGLRLALSFARLFVAAGRGDNLVAAAKEHLSPSLTKKMVRCFRGDTAAAAGALPPPPPRLRLPEDVHHEQPPEVRSAGPLAALRAAQVAAFGVPGSAVVAPAATLATRLGVAIGSPEEEEFAVTVLEWACRFADAPELQDQRAMSQAMEWLLTERATDPGFSLTVNGNARSPKKVIAAAISASESLELQRLQTTGELFEKNPAGIKGFVKRGVDAAFDPQCIVPMSEIHSPNSWRGDRYEPSEEEERLLADPLARRKATVRIDEILSFEYMQYVGRSLQNCLQAERRGGHSLFKYLSRARSRDSSYWVMTLTEDGGGEGEAASAAAAGERMVEHLLLIEVYNEFLVIHQAEGPHPRRWPRLDAWAWLREWAEHEGLSADGPEGVTVGPGGWEEAYGAAMGRRKTDPWDIREVFLW